MSITSQSLLVSARGGILEYISEDGEVLFEIAVPPGKVSASEFVALCPEGARVEVGEGLAAIEPRSRLGFQAAELATESGANPDFEPTSADRLQRQMRLTMAQMQADQRRIDARLAALSQIERVPMAPRNDAQVIEPAAGAPGGE